MAKKKKIRARKLANRPGGVKVFPATSLAKRMADSRLTRPVAAPAAESTYYLELADIALGGKSDPNHKKGGA